MSKRDMKQSGRDGNHRNSSGAICAKRGDTMTLGLRAFEQISAIEGVTLTAQMRHDAILMSEQRLSKARKK